MLFRSELQSNLNQHLKIFFQENALETSSTKWQNDSALSRLGWRKPFRQKKISINSWIKIIVLQNIYRISSYESQSLSPITWYSVDVFFYKNTSEPMLIYSDIDMCTLQWRHNGRDCVSNHQPCHCLLNRLLRLRSKKTSKLRITGLCVGNSPVTGEFPAQMASNGENVSIWWRHHAEQATLHYLNQRQSGSKLNQCWN